MPVSRRLQPIAAQGFAALGRRPQAEADAAVAPPAVARDAARPARGFTLIELLMVISIGVALMATFVVVGMNYYKVAAMRQKCSLQLAAFSGYLEGSGKKRWSVNPGSDVSARPPINPYMWDLPAPAPLNETVINDPETGDPRSIWTSNDWDTRTWERRDGYFPDPKNKATLVTIGNGAVASRRVQGDGILDGFAFRNATGKVVRFEAIVVRDSSNDDYAPFHGYTGFVQLNKVDINDKEIDEETGELIDPWGRPFRILFYDQGDSTFDDPKNPGSKLNPFGTQPCGIYSTGPDGVDDTRDSPFKAGTDDVRSWEKVHHD